MSSTLVDSGGDAVVTSLEERFSVMDERSLKASIMNHLREGRVFHVLDLARIENVTASLANALLSLLYATRRKGGFFALVIAKLDVLHLFEIAGLDGIFPIFPDVAHAIGAAEACARDRSHCSRALLCGPGNDSNQERNPH